MSVIFIDSLVNWKRWANLNALKGSLSAVCFVWVWVLVSQREELWLRAFQCRALRDEVRGEWIRLHNKGLYDLYCSPNIFGVIKYRRMRWAGHMERMGYWRGTYRVLLVHLRERYHLEDLGLDRRIILKCILKKWDGESWTEVLCLTTRNAVVNLRVP